jgi:uncharacterized membrane protein
MSRSIAKKNRVFYIILLIVIPAAGISVVYYLMYLKQRAALNALGVDEKSVVLAALGTQLVLYALHELFRRLSKPNPNR